MSLAPPKRLPGLLILLLSKLLHRWVESPAIAFGRRLNFR